MSVVNIAEDIETGATVIGKVAGGIETVLPWLMLAGGFIPGLDSVISAIEIASPIIKRVATAAPLVVQALADGMPIAQAIDNSGPTVIDDIRQLFAWKNNTDVNSVSDEQTYQFAGPIILGRQWTDAEMQRGWDKATGQGF